MVPYAAMRPLLLPRQIGFVSTLTSNGAFPFLKHGGQHSLLRTGNNGVGSVGGPMRSFSSFNHNIGPHKSDPPASEKPLYLNRFDQADDPALFQLEAQQLEQQRLLKGQTSDIVDTANVVQPSNHPHQRKGFLKRMRYWHYHQTAEPTFPRTPDLSKGGEGSAPLCRIRSLPVPTVV